MTVNTELLFKIAFLIMFLSFAGTMSVYRRRAEKAIGNWQERIKEHNAHEVKALLVLRTLFGIPFYLGVLGWLFFSTWMKWAALPLPVWARIAGVILGVLAVALNLWSHRTLSAKLGAAFNPALRLATVPALVTSGPYRWVRHPIYLAFFLMMVASALVTANAVIGFAGIALILCVIMVRTAEEERLLIGQFGDDYRNYMKCTGGYLPFA